MCWGICESERNQAMVSQTESRLAVGAVSAATSAAAAQPAAAAKLAEFSLARQASIYSLTLDEFQNTIGEPGKNFGSMNMEEFLKNVWTVEETQAMAAAMSGTGNINNNNNNDSGLNLARQASLQKQGSLTLPRTWSRKTVDDVWREIHRESNNGTADNGSAESPSNTSNDNTTATANNNNNSSSNCVQTRQPTFGEMTLEDFLVKAGVVREEPERTQAEGFDLGIGNSLGLGIGHRNGQIKGCSVTATAATPIAGLSLSGNPAAAVGMDLHGGDWITGQYRDNLQHQQQQQFLHADVYKRAAAAAAAANGGLMGIGNGGLMGGIAGFCHSPLALGAGSPASPLSSDGVGPSSHVENPNNISPVGYGLDCGFRGGRKRGFEGPVEKVVERRQRRMIKNRESAARSRARKQAYTVELEAEVTQLKEENSRLRKQQEELEEQRRKQILEAPLAKQLGTRNRVLRRTLTGPW